MLGFRLLSWICAGRWFYCIAQKSPNVYSEPGSVDSSGPEARSVHVFVDVCTKVISADIELLAMAEHTLHLSAPIQTSSSVR